LRAKNKITKGRVSHQKKALSEAKRNWTSGEKVKISLPGKI